MFSLGGKSMTLLHSVDKLLFNGLLKGCLMTSMFSMPFKGSERKQVISHYCDSNIFDWGASTITNLKFNPNVWASLWQSRERVFYSLVCQKMYQEIDPCSLSSSPSLSLLLWWSWSCMGLAWESWRERVCFTLKLTAAVCRWETCRGLGYILSFSFGDDDF